MSNRKPDSLPHDTLKMLDLGMRLFPVAAKGKHPLVRGWPKKATTDRDQIARWANHFVGCNWGIATGHESGCLVVDVDGDAGQETIEAWKEKHDDGWMRTLISKTGKGFHIFFRCTEELNIRNSAGQIAPGIDIRGEGGFVVAPGSVHSSGATYRIECDQPIAEPRSWLLESILNRSPSVITPTKIAGLVIASQAQVAEVCEGGRNSSLTMLAGGMRRKAMACESIAAALVLENQKRCKPPLEEAEVLAIAQSVSRYAPEYEPPMTEIGFKETFVTEFGQDIRIVDGREWRIWEQIQRGGRWKIDTTREIEDRVQRFLRVQASFLKNPRHAPAVASTHMVQNLVKLARSDRRLAVTRDRFDSNPMVLNTPCGLIDFTNNTCFETMREDYCSKITAVGPKSMPTPLWQSYLDTFHPDIDRQRFLQRFFGYSLTGDTREQVLVFGHGPAKNGKSTCLNIVAWIMGEYATTPSMDAFISEERHSKHPADLAALVGARLAVAAETQEGRWWDEVKVKQCTGGDRIAARFMRQDFFTFQPQFKLFFVGNHRPRIRTVDEAMRRRFLIVPFDVTLPDDKRIRGYEELLKAEAPGILWWMIEGTKAWLNGEYSPDSASGEALVQVRAPGLLAPESVLAASRDYMEAEDTPNHWFEECAESRPESWTLIRDLYQSYRDWIAENGLKDWSNKRFSNWLSEQPGIRAEKHGGGLRGYRGIGLKGRPL